MKSYSVLKRRIITEKAAPTESGRGVYVFEVDIQATKKDVALAVEKYFSVSVDRVRTLISRGKVKNRGVKVYKQSNRKKAYVTLDEGQTIKALDEV